MLDGIGIFIFDFQVDRNSYFPFFIGTGIYFLTSQGSIVSIGLQGLKKWNDSIVGGFNNLYSSVWGNLGVFGFTGIHYFAPDLGVPFTPFEFFLGSAIAIKISSNSSS
jgi:hypothetical protein